MVQKSRASGLRDISNIEIPWENPEVVWKVPSGGYCVQRCDSQWDWQMETYFLAHCLGTKDYDEFSRAHVVYSLRDILNIPHATILCVREDEPSPYGMCWDIGSYSTFAPEGENLRILQVRGRNDDIAHPIFHALAREWYASNGGRIDIEIERIVNFLRIHGDSDVNYHFRYLLDETTNHFEWAHWNHRASTEAWWRGEIRL